MTIDLPSEQLAELWRGVPSPIAGVLTEIIVAPGSELEVGDPVCRVAT